MQLKSLILIHLTLHISGVESKDISKLNVQTIKTKTRDRKSKKENKTRWTYIAWQDNEETSSSISSKKRVRKICFAWWLDMNV